MFHHLLIANYLAVNDLMKSGTVFDEKWDLYSLDDGTKVYLAVESVPEFFAAKNGKEVAKFSHEGNGEI